MFVYVEPEEKNVGPPDNIISCSYANTYMVETKTSTEGYVVCICFFLYYSAFFDMRTPGIRGVHMKKIYYWNDKFINLYSTTLPNFRD